MRFWPGIFRNFRNQYKRISNCRLQTGCQERSGKRLLNRTPKNVETQYSRDGHLNQVFWLFNFILSKFHIQQRNIVCIVDLIKFLRSWQTNSRNHLSLLMYYMCFHLTFNVLKTFFEIGLSNREINNKLKVGIRPYGQRCKRTRYFLYTFNCRNLNLSLSKTLTICTLVNQSNMQFQRQ